MAKKSVATFIRDNRTEIDNIIKTACSNCGRLNNEERENWILNDEGLYNWALSENVDV